MAKAYTTDEKSARQLVAAQYASLVKTRQALWRAAAPGAVVAGKSSTKTMQARMQG
ncbi:hypothetical protein OG874_14125 [Nocardia sp. NBC_00565]|uniref:hypothetical protein n=1 Tax=Nocardia sp. NBC_00565 TaxID=2975993 RepID=UPI002E8111C7|nr:hypothetical protein [Nocardia sp. NBC_00565]WUC06198.1 hypothetical protein OG874_14125 [Nocardia sp. NBC_00565]